MRNFIQLSSFHSANIRYAHGLIHFIVSRHDKGYALKAYKKINDWEIKC
jgi:hypothetical protein